MTYLLDVNLLIALCDPEHTHHDLAHRWFGSLSPRRWATCPLTENAFVRITGHSAYTNWKRTPLEQIEMLQKFCRLPGHQFWADDISLLTPTIWASSGHVRSADLTDLYLLALAIKNRGKFASLDDHISPNFIRSGREALLVLSDSAHS